MIIKLESAFKKMERQRKKLIKELDKLSEEQLTFKPNENSWNVLEVCLHLIVAEENSLKYMSKKVKGLEKLNEAGLWSKFRLAFLNSLISTKIKFKAPKVVELQQGSADGMDYPTIVKRWDDVRSEMYRFTDKLDHKASEKVLFKHPFAGRFNVYQLFSFIEKHVQHHVFQIERIEKDPQFPKK